MRYATVMAKRTRAELWIKLSLPGIGQIGPGKMELLRQIDDHDSIAAAARAMNMSYRRAWLLIDEMNKLFDEPVVAKWQGGKSRGGASLTDFGRSLLEKYAALVESSNEVNREILDEIAERVNSSG